MKLLLLSLCIITALAFPIPTEEEEAKECNPNLLYDAYLYMLQDVRGPPSQLILPLDKKVQRTLAPFCTAKMKDMYGKDFGEWIRNDSAPQPCGFSAFSSTNIGYRLYGISSPQFKGNYPVTNGMVFDDSYIFIATIAQPLGGMWGEMMMEMGMSNVIMPGEWITCGQYRVFENDTKSSYQIVPEIRFWAAMPMMPMFATSEMSFFDADNLLNCDLESSLWGTGSALGFGGVRTDMVTGDITLSVRTVATFPASIWNRTTKPMTRKCRNLPKHPKCLYDERNSTSL